METWQIPPPRLFSTLPFTYVPAIFQPLLAVHGSKNEFTEIQNKAFYFSNGLPYTIEKAIQTIEFELDRKGGKIKSEAGMMAKNESAIMFPEERREFFIDDTFAIFLIEEGKDAPYFAGKINDITKFQ